MLHITHGTSRYPVFERSGIPCYKPWRQCCIILSDHPWIEDDIASKQFGFIPSSSSLISSNADHPRKNRFKKNMPVSKPGQKRCSSKEQSQAVSNEMNIMLISVLYKKIKIKQASGSVKPMLFLCVMTRTVNLPSLFICSQCSQQWNLVICGQMNQQCYDLLTRSLVKYVCVMTRTVNLPSVFICGQWNQQWNLAICSQLNQQYYHLATRNIVMKSARLDQCLCVMTRTVNQPNLCVMTRSINLPSVCIWGNQQYHNLATRKWHNQLICGQCQRLLGNSLGHSLKYLGTLSIQYYPCMINNLCVKIPQASAGTHLWVQMCVQIQWRCNLTICSQWKLSSRSHKSIQGNKYKQANVKGTLRPKLDL